MMPVNQIFLLILIFTPPIYHIYKKERKTAVLAILQRLNVFKYGNNGDIYGSIG